MNNKLSQTIFLSDKTKLTYDDGWNARIDNVPFDEAANLDWRDGWLDCNDVDLELRKPRVNLTFNLKEI